MSSSGSSSKSSSIRTFKALEIPNNVFPEASSKDVLPEPKSVKVVFGIPLNWDKR